MKIAAHVLEESARAALKPSERLGVAEWADRHRVLPSQNTQRPGAWSTAYVPYTRGIMDAFTDPAITTITVMKATQVAGTESLVNMLLYTVCCDPGPWLLVYPSLDLARKFSTERLVPSLQACAAARARLKGSPRDVKVLQIGFDRMSVYLVGSQSESNLAMMPIRYVGFDEIDAAEFDPAALKLARERTRTYTRAKIVQVSKPSFFGAGIHAQYQLSDQRRYHVPCPACGLYQVIRFADIRWEGGSHAPPRQARETARWVCPAGGCKGEVEDRAKAAWIARGLWVGLHQRIETDEQTGVARVVGDGGGWGGHAGFHLPSILSPSVSFGDLAAKFAEQHRMDRDFVNGELGEAWEETADRIEPHELTGLRAAALSAASKHSAANPSAPRPRVVTNLLRRGGDVPEGIVSVFGGIDLQAASAYYTLWGFTAMGRTRQLLSHGVVPVALEGRSEGLAALDKLVSWTDGMVFRAADGLPIRPATWGIDSGDRTREVYLWATTHHHVIATKGRSGQSFAGLLDYKAIPLAAALAQLKGQPKAERADALKFLGFNTDRYKESLFGLLRASMSGGGGGGSGEPKREELPPVVLPMDVGEDFLRQLTSEQLTRRSVRHNGAVRTVLAWALRPGQTANHYLDATTICWAVADAVGIGAVTDEHYLQYRDAVRQAASRGDGIRQPAIGIRAEPSRMPNAESRVPDTPERKERSQSGFDIDESGRSWIPL